MFLKIFFACLIFFQSFFFFFFFLMNSLVKMYIKRHDKHNKTLWTTDFLNSVFCLVSCSSKNQVPYFILNKVVTDSNLTHLAAQEKKIGLVFQSVTSFKTDFFFFILALCMYIYYTPVLIYWLFRAKKRQETQTLYSIFVQGSLPLRPSCWIVDISCQF